MSSTKVDQKILFNSRAKNYAFLSNSWVSDITIDNRIYNHVEGYWQASKHLGEDDKVAERVRLIVSPIICKKVSERYPMTDERENKWNAGYRLIVMKRAVLTKFITDQDLAKKLISTGDSNLIYNDCDDNYWGSGSDNKGENTLGKILMETRGIIKNLPNDYE